MCELASAVIRRDGAVFVEEDTQGHGCIRERHGLVDTRQMAGISGATGALAPTAYDFELTPTTWRRGGSAWPHGVFGRSFRVPDVDAHTRLFYPDIPNAVMKAGDRLADDLRSAAVAPGDDVTHPSELPWVTVVRGGRVHLDRVQYLVVMNDAVVRAGYAQQVWAMDDADVRLGECGMRNVPVTKSIQFIALYQGKIPAYPRFDASFTIDCLPDAHVYDRAVVRVGDFVCRSTGVTRVYDGEEVTA